MYELVSYIERTNTQDHQKYNAYIFYIKKKKKLLLLNLL